MQGTKVLLRKLNLMNTQADSTVKERIAEVKINIAEVKTEVNARIDKLENHFDAKFDRVFNKLGI